MRALLAVLVVLPFLATVTALCNVTGLNAPVSPRALIVATSPSYFGIHCLREKAVANGSLLRIYWICELRRRIRGL
jgi:hypothetical protein